VITLAGDAALDIEQGATYSDAGATATDTVDGSVTVVTTGSVDIATAGTYILTYTATDNAGNVATKTRAVTVPSNEVTLNVFSKGEVDPTWDEGINAADSGIDWSTCANDGGADCPNIAWEIVEDSDRGSVLQVEHSSAGEQAILYFKTATPTNLSLYAGGKILFDIKTISGNSSYTMKIDCIYPCTSGDKTLGAKGYNGWETISVNVDELVNQGLILETIDTGLVIWASQYTNTIFQLDNVRWEDTDGGGTTVEEPLADDGWVIPSFTGYESPSTYDGYSLTWSDEFSGTEINDDNWGYDIGGSGWGNNELQYHTNRNTYLKDGLLVIRAQQEAYRGRNYTSSRLKTQGKQNFKYGRIDVRARLPEGAGIWPALWMLGENITDVGWPKSGEIDIMEMVGGNSSQDRHPDGDRTAHGTMHWNNNGLNGSYSPVNTGKSEILSTSLSEEFHVFSIQWDVNGIGWYIDDVQYSYKTINSTQPFREEFFFIMNIAVGGDWPGSPNSSTVFPQRMVIDYVRVFQKN
jgi:beta-glucanase (GH16 family)